MKSILLFGFTLWSFNQIGFSQNVQNQLSSNEKKNNWKLLFDGKTTNGWHLYNKGKIASAWGVKDGALYCDPLNKDEHQHGDLVTDNEYENYDLKFEWKITKGGNSGVFINVLERSDLTTAWLSGPEYQLLENTHADYAKPKSRAGCLYGFSILKNKVEPKPVGEWNQSEIVQKNGVIKFYLNGVLTAEQDFKSKEWKDMVGQTYFKSIPDFGKYTKGKISLQDWNKGISFKNIKIKTYGK